MTTTTSDQANIESPPMDFGDLKSQCVAPRPSIMGRRRSLSGILWLSAKGILRGLLTTLSYFRRPSTVVTQQYPENRDTLQMFERYRGRLSLIHNEDGEHGCTGCQICERLCPNGSIIVTKDKKNEATGKPALDQFIWRQDTCTFCNICVLVCPFDTLEMTGDFESSVYDRRLLVFNLNEYAGPTADQLEKLGDEELAKAQMKPMKKYQGPVPMCGGELDGIPKLDTGKSDDA
ncbi:NADH-quinone oxidoreductase subunit I [Stieleria maiorica]|uniref:NADH-quinone oxidoreductase subunit I n=1 Tax=Stieleria maiorica TaxID=2795974 RepID=A0A5B9MPE0_9BACT|nr:4Fe-4S binding protein [Stieleria maiorica]QEG01971.1 NADH-quinone oxidoreductase subunit I [Stieleria maiorica]